MRQGIEQIVRDHLEFTLRAIKRPNPSYRGKVRDVFARGNELLMVATDRVSAFDVVVGTVPLKGALLTEQAAFWLDKSQDVVPNHLLERVDPQILRCKKARPLRVEMVVRGYLAGSLLRKKADERGVDYGVQIDPNLKPYDKFDTPILTPTTKAINGEHDLPITLPGIVGAGLATEAELLAMKEAAMGLFQLGSRFAEERGLLLVDTKYEFGIIDDKVVLIDEIHTADSSRFWIKESYTKHMNKGLAPEMLDKERLRRTLLERGFDGSNLATMPQLDDNMRIDLACHYWQLTEMLLGKPFLAPVEFASERVRKYLG